MRAGAKGEARVDFDADASGGRGVIAPFRANEDALANFHGLQEFMRERNPVAEIGRGDFAGELSQQFGLARVIIEKGPQPRCFGGICHFDDAGAAGFPKICDGYVFVCLLTVVVD